MSTLNKLLNFILLIGIFLLSNCASSHMMEVTPLTEPDNHHAIVTFIRPSFLGGAIQFGIWDGENPVGILSAGSYVQYLTTPGEHLFIARSENWSYIKADLMAGKQYFIIGKVFPGIWKARVALDPVKKNDNSDMENVDKWLAKLKSTALIPEKKNDYKNPRLSHIRSAIAQFEAGDVKYEVLESYDYK